ncbi:MAG: hypothetical protein JSW00_19795 [Thermoplasmata archaeon]|nr:MAG: hypothetical protein JSW00_19795 [Thermoplasmata archaeon]
MTAYDVIIRPHQPWRQDGMADVWVTEAPGAKKEKTHIVATLPLIHNDGAAPGSIPVDRATYSHGLLVMTGVNHLPQPGDPTPTITLKLEITDDTSLNAPDHGWPNGNGGVLFI